ncbi:mRNA interferase MazF [Verrucomicrobium sp. GAS474]|uniref:type II toxin-antitoxin system PemK/MazF family toxin n=1 Tax=Verrucomicrobium sp. GAS474 TaxID=1882831 RepID=UPI00087A88A0|nr:type II toxin-antitoxin system PemK/MazF family toxin [Verrucomicrobium sp. GAS474]SDT86727.1 mRNA interferase MazF [Verrucomicrobium sp. GAS474]
MALIPSEIETYGLYLADLGAVPGRDLRGLLPVVLVSREEMNAALDTVVVCPLSTNNHPAWRSRILIRHAGKESGIAVDQIRSLRADRLVRKLGQLTQRDATELRRLICEMYGTA